MCCVYAHSELKSDPRSASPKRPIARAHFPGAFKNWLVLLLRTNTSIQNRFLCTNMQEKTELDKCNIRMNMSL